LRHIELDVKMQAEIQAMAENGPGGAGVIIRGSGRAIIKAINGLKVAEDVYKLSKNQVSHILTRHSTNSAKNQIVHWKKKMTNEQIDEMLSKRSFFNKDWSDDKIIEASQIAYTQLINRGVKDGLHPVTVFGEEIKIFMKNGNLDSAYGLHQYKLSDFFD
ncbi:hypothetical protein P4V64_31335, partial [Bacillus thuringiensis]|nr:hypothetical protein [Bacillus thuringiensis]